MRDVFEQQRQWVHDRACSGFDSRRFDFHARKDGLPINEITEHELWSTRHTEAPYRIFLVHCLLAYIFPLTALCDVTRASHSFSHAQKQNRYRLFFCVALCMWRVSLCCKWKITNARMPNNCNLFMFHRLST